MSPAADHPARHWVVVPAAGVGRRFGSAVPKQYLPLGDQPMIRHTLQRLQSVSAIDGGVVALAVDDRWWPELAFPGKDWWRTVTGGAERSDSVLAALEALAGQANEDDWVLVHDVARPCVMPSDIQQLIRAVETHPVGGILAVPLTDTVKLATADSAADSARAPHIETTLDRNRLWAAQTPQMFRYGLLRSTLSELTRRGVAVTDEAAAMEHRGLSPRLVAGRRDNIKVTGPGDIAMAAAILEVQSVEGEEPSAHKEPSANKELL